MVPGLMGCQHVHIFFLFFFLPPADKMPFDSTMNNLGQVTVTPKAGAAALLVSQAPVASRVPCMVIGRPRSPSRRIAVPRPFRSSVVFPQGRWKALIGRPIRFGSLYRTLFAVPGDLALPLQPHLCHPAYARNPSVLYAQESTGVSRSVSDTTISCGHPDMGRVLSCPRVSILEEQPWTSRSTARSVRSSFFLSLLVFVSAKHSNKIR